MFCINDYFEMFADKSRELNNPQQFNDFVKAWYLTNHEFFPKPYSYRVASIKTGTIIYNYFLITIFNERTKEYCDFANNYAEFIEFPHIEEMVLMYNFRFYMLQIISHIQGNEKVYI